jgi:hypothetical protein
MLGRTLLDYELFIYALQDGYPSIQMSTLTVIRQASDVATHPHHKHIPPNVRHHRIPAPELSFTEPNLPFLIQEIEQLLKT